MPGLTWPGRLTFLTSGATLPLLDVAVTRVATLPPTQTTRTICRFARCRFLPDVCSTGPVRYARPVLLRSGRAAGFKTPDEGSAQESIRCDVRARGVPRSAVVTGRRPKGGDSGYRVSGRERRCLGGWRKARNPMERNFQGGALLLCPKVGVDTDPAAGADPKGARRMVLHLCGGGWDSRGRGACR